MRVARRLGFSHSLISRPNDSSTSEVLANYLRWKLAWESKDLDTFMSFYAPQVVVRDADGRTFGYKALRERRRKRWAEEQFIVITDLGGVTMVPTGRQVKLTVRRIYKSTTQDYVGTKLMTWQRSGSGWRIVNESFRQDLE